ncbi:MAG: hypothetical protein RR270_02455, partial [Alistipes sp.]
MKRTLKLLAMALMAGAMVTACGGDDNGNPEPPTPPTPEGNFPDVTITSKVSGAVKAGLPDAITISGKGFDPDLDYIKVGYEDGGALNTDNKVLDAALTLNKTRVAFGISIDAPYLGKTVKIYLDRPGYDPMPLTGDITFTMPTVAEGYIPDPAFRATLINLNPNVKVLFSALGMLDVEGAAAIKTGDGTYGLNLYACTANSLEGIELFTGVTGLIPAWDMPNVKEIDLSKWTAKSIDFRCERAAKLEKFICAPWAKTVIIHSCPKLTYVDAHNCNWMDRLNINDFEKNTDGGKNSNVTYFDVRRDMSGTYNDNPTKPEFYRLWGGCGFKVGDNATILVDSWFLWDHNVGNCTWSDIYDAWKTRGATIKVYSRVKPYTDELLGTVPMASVDPNALSPNNKNGKDPA